MFAYIFNLHSICLVQKMHSFVANAYLVVFFQKLQLLVLRRSQVKIGQLLTFIILCEAILSVVCFLENSQQS